MGRRRRGGGPNRRGPGGEHGRPGGARGARGRRPPRRPSPHRRRPPSPRTARGAGIEAGSYPAAPPEPPLPPPPAEPDAPNAAPAAPPTETYRGFRLHPFQQRALDAIRRGSSVLVAAPTGSGKTLVADFAIEAALAEGKRIAYTAPVKALSNQKYRDFRASLGEDRVGIMTGDVTLNPGAPLLIMTTEVFRNTIFEDPRNLDDCSAVIFDEIHYIDDRERGTVWEESIIFAPDHVRIVGLSATIPNIEELAAWMRSIRPGDVEVVIHERRPVPLRHFVFHAEAGVRTIRELRRDPPRRRHGGGRFRRGPYARGRDHRRMIDHMQRNDLLPCLYFSFSRRECEERAEENSTRDLLLPEERERLLAQFDDLAARYMLEPSPVATTLRRLVSRGIAYHHAGLLPVHKEIVERLFTGGLVKLLFTTETFALGVNMPARTVAFASLKKFDGVRVDWLLGREYGQMAGRAGRQGIDAVGHVISRVDDRDLDFRYLEYLFEGAVEAVESRFDIDYATLLNLYARVGDAVVDAYERSFARFQRDRRHGDRPVARPAREAETLRSRVRVLKETGYIADGRLTPKGRFAAAVQGFEIHAAEFLEGGILHACDAPRLALLFCAVVFEERRGDASERVDAAMLEEVRHRAERRIALFRRHEAEARLEDLSKELDWKMSGPALHWAGGCTWEDLARRTTVSDGDLVRCFRQAIQVMRNVRAALHHMGAGELEDRFSEAVRRMNREAVDAKRQLELG